MPQEIIKIIRRTVIAIKNKVSFCLLMVRNKIQGLPPYKTDWVGYESLLHVIKKNKTYKLEGDAVEIGSFLGGGTAKLARFFDKYNKKVYAIDIFDPRFDLTESIDGTTLASLYLNILKGRDQYEIYKEVTRKYSNVITIKEDSKKVTLPCKKICFSFIDGCHYPDYVKNDFYLVWDKTVPSGIAGLHDYGYLPQVTKAIDELIKANKNSIKKIEQIKEKWIILFTKK